MEIKLGKDQFLSVDIHSSNNYLPAIYCTGFGETKNDYHNKRMINSLAKFYFVIAFDYRDTGKSSGNIKNLKTSNMVEDLRTVYNQIKSKFPEKKWDDATIIGWSHGTLVSLIFSTKQRFRNLILIGYDGFVEKTGAKVFLDAWKKLKFLPDVKLLQKGLLNVNKRKPISYSYHLDLIKYKKENILPKVKAKNILILQGALDEFSETKKDMNLLKNQFKIIKLLGIGHELNISRVLPYIKSFVQKSLKNNRN